MIIILAKLKELLHFVVGHHRFISFLMYMFGFLWFVVSLRKGYYIRQFSLVSLF